MRPPRTALTTSLFLSLFFHLHAQISFTNQTTWLDKPGNFFSGAAIGVADINNDGKDDIARLNYTSNLNIELQQESSEPFLHFEFDEIAGGWALAITDIHKNGICDILLSDGHIQRFRTGVDSIPSFYNLPGPSYFAQGTNFVDIDNDGAVDIFSCNDNGLSKIWRNMGDGTFSNANNWIDMQTDPPSDNSGNYGSVWADFDNDGDIDLYISKCRLGVLSKTDPRRINALFVNDGQGNFTEQAEEYGLKIGWQSWAADFQDIDNDGDFDCMVVNHDYILQILENDGTGHFTDISEAAGTSNIGGLFNQGIMRDFDNDGFVDILTANQALLLRNNGNKTFTLVSLPFNANSFAVGDLNHDGFLDVYTANQCGYNYPCGVPDELWISEGNDNHFLVVRLEGTVSNPKGVGAKVEIHGSWGIQVREVRAGESYGISNTLNQHFGIGEATEVECIIVRWPSGIVDVVKSPSIDQFITVKEGTTCVASTETCSETYRPTPDVSVQIDGVLCENDSFLLKASICNDGYSSLPDSIPIAFFDRDPRIILGNYPPLAAVYTTDTLPAESCISIAVKVKTAYYKPYFVVANIDLEEPIFFTNFQNDFQYTETTECRYENNYASFDINYGPPYLNLFSVDEVICEGEEMNIKLHTNVEQTQWFDGSIALSYPTTEPGIFWAEGWGICGTHVSDTIKLMQNDKPPVDLGDDFEICRGDSVQLSAPGFQSVWWHDYSQSYFSCQSCTEPFVFPQNTRDIVVTAYDGHCSSNDTVKITVHQIPNFIFLPYINDCDDPYVSLSTVYGEGPFTYSWSDGTMDSVIYPSQSGVYAVTVEDVNGCQREKTISVNVREKIDFEIAQTAILCSGENTGSIDLEVVNGEEPFSFLWSNNAETEDIDSLIGGLYSVTITDKYDCTAEATVIVEEPDPIFIQPVTIDVSCDDNEAGTVSLVTSGGTSPYSFLWSNEETASQISVMVPETYSVTVTDSFGCQATAIAIVGLQGNLHTISELTPISCNPDNGNAFDGAIAVQPLSGNAPYTYLWNNGQVDSIVSGLGTGIYQVTIADAIGCSNIELFELETPAALTLSANVSDVQCFGEMTGMVETTASGGTPDYKFAWDSGDTTSILDNLPAGIYKMTITDKYGCQDSIAVSIGEPPLLEVIAQAEPMSLCLGDSTTLTAIATGGTPPYSYLWNDSLSDSIWLNVPIGLYETSVVDSNGCMASEVILLGENSPAIFVQDTIEAATGVAIADGAITLKEIIGGTPPFNFLWSNGDTSQSVGGLLPGSYSLTIADAVGCNEVFEFEVDIMVSTGQTFRANFEATLYPNPIQQNPFAILSIYSINSQTATLKLFDASGRISQKETLLLASGQTIHKLQKPRISGVYFLELTGEDRKVVLLKWIVLKK